MRVLLLGAGGMLGRDLVASAPREVEVIGRSHAELDITDHARLSEAVAVLRPDVIINAAAYTAVDQAESEPDVAFRVNAEAVGDIGRLAAKQGALVVHFSTDYVFDGDTEVAYTEYSPAAPLNEYGLSKLAGEEYLRNSGARHLIIRTQWLFGTSAKCFASTVVSRVREGNVMHVVSDQIGRPTCASDVATVVWELLGSDVEGVLNVANSGVASWYAYARHIATAMERPELVQSCTTTELSRPAARPRFSVLDTTTLERLLGRQLRTWRDAVDEFLTVAQT